MAYTRPALNAVNFGLGVYSPPSRGSRQFILGTLAAHTPPALNAVSFGLAIYTPPILAGVNFNFQVGVYYGMLKRWGGSAFAKELLKVFTGGAWQAKPMKRWSGTDWLEVDTTGT